MCSVSGKECDAYSEKIKVAEKPVIVCNGEHCEGRYYMIKYRKVGENSYTLGFGSYNLKFVAECYRKMFEITEEEPQLCSNIVIGRNMVRAIKEGKTLKDLSGKAIEDILHKFAEEKAES